MQSRPPLSHPLPVTVPLIPEVRGQHTAVAVARLAYDTHRFPPAVQPEPDPLRSERAALEVHRRAGSPQQVFAVGLRALVPQGLKGPLRDGLRLRPIPVAERRLPGQGAAFARLESAADTVLVVAGAQCVGQAVPPDGARPANPLGVGDAGLVVVGEHFVLVADAGASVHPLACGFEVARGSCGDTGHDATSRRWVRPMFSARTASASGGGNALPICSSCLVRLPRHG